MIFFSVLILTIFLWKRIIENYRTRSEQVKNDLLEKGGVDGFSYFSLMFSYFIFCSESSMCNKSYCFTIFALTHLHEFRDK